MNNKIVLGVFFNNDRTIYEEMGVWLLSNGLDSSTTKEGLLKLANSYLCDKNANTLLEPDYIFYEEDLLGDLSFIDNFNSFLYINIKNLYAQDVVSFKEFKKFGFTLSFSSKKKTWKEPIFEDHINFYLVKLLFKKQKYSYKVGDNGEWISTETFDMEHEIRNADSVLIEDREWFNETVYEYYLKNFMVGLDLSDGIHVELSYNINGNVCYVNDFKF